MVPRKPSLPIPHQKTFEVHLRRLRQILRISWKVHIPNVEVLRRANMPITEAILTAFQLRWPGCADWTCHPYERQQTPKGGVLRGINQREMYSEGTTADIQICSQKTREGHTHSRRHLGDSATRSTTVEAGHTQRKEPY